MNFSFDSLNDSHREHSMTTRHKPMMSFQLIKRIIKPPDPSSLNHQTPFQDSYVKYQKQVYQEPELKCLKLARRVEQPSKQTMEKNKSKRKSCGHEA
jgi:hypothetical protein